jgi:hypothetical protein
MKCVATVFDVVAFVLGMGAAWFWLKASLVTVDDPYPPNGVVPNQEPGDYVIPMLNASRENARWNKVAALLAGLSVICGVIGNLASHWPLWPR